MFIDTEQETCPIVPLTESALAERLQELSDSQKSWVEANDFRARPGTFVTVPDTGGGLACVLAGIEESDRLWALAHLPAALPAGRYRLDEGATSKWTAAERERVLLGWALGHYRFDRYKPGERIDIRLAADAAVTEPVEVMRDAVFRVRDLVNTPALQLGPTELADVAGELGERRDAEFSVVEGEELEREFPAIHVVGQASTRAPKLIRLKWGDPSDPPLALVGKGVIFDTGGLDIKPGTGMVLMKKDMGGAAHALGLAELIMRLGLKVHLRVYIPAVENAIAGNAYRPSDIITTRNGTTVEIGNTDAEGRVVLSDALTLACEDGAERIIDFATLTGAARVALGGDLPPIYGRDAAAARAVQDLAFEVEDPLWHMPLYKPYKSQIEPAIADLSNTGASKLAGSLTAALFLEHFVKPEVDWFHLDIYAWNRSDRPGRPAGGEAQGMRAMWAWLQQVYPVIA